jgi:hypothetical protein
MKSIAHTLASIAPRRLLLLGAALALGLTALVPVLALAAPAASHTASACNLACLQKFGDDQIAARFASLDALNTKITALGPDGQGTSGTATTTATATAAKGLLTADQVTALQNQIQNERNSLTTLKQKIDADTDAATARADDQSIMKQYRVYAVFLPLLRHTVWVDLMTNALGKMADLDDKIQTGISSAPASQQTQLNALFKDYKAKVADAQTQLTNAATLFASMTPDAYNKNPSGFKITTLGALHKDTIAAHKDIKAARTDLHQIAMILKADETNGSGTGTPGTTTTPTSTSTPSH